ncbi:MAG: hypothetical protein NT062_04880 [Proteobacteria bacterium]|nr:hypothetical protein [Pseudomonadota bacterium]
MRSIFLVGILLSGCGGAPKPMEALGDTVRAYNEGVRWERFALAANALPPRQRATFIDEWDERSHDLKISDYEVVKVEPTGKTSMEAKVQIKRSWYLTSEGTLRETQSIQTWERHGKDWYLVDDTRLRGPEMPGVTEPAVKASPVTADRTVPAADPPVDR